jgi:phenylacetate-coenzyme A ligase PaaK-like adenylate-forming protein
MSAFTSTAKAYLNFALGLRSFLRETCTIDDIKDSIREQVINREDTFLNTIRTNVFEYPKSPYLPLLRHAKLTYADIEKMVSQNGLEGALEELYEAGVYVTFEELKGRVPIKRGDLEYHVANSDFDNPNLKTVMFTQSSGSTGVPTRTKLDLDFVHHNGGNYALGYAVHGIFGVPAAHWDTLMPDIITIKTALRFAHTGHRLDRWFTPMRTSPTSPSWYYTVLTYLMVALVRLHGHRFPIPKYVPINDPLPIVQWMVRALETNGKCVLFTSTSKAIRVSLTAQEHGLDLTGAILSAGGEPSTDAKIKIIEDSGAKHVTTYSSVECGAIGIACNNPHITNDMHFISNQLALIQRPVEVLDQTVDAICLTSLLPVAPKMLLNAQTDDFGVVETRDCGCPLYELGLHQHIHGIRSYRKLTGEGVTLVGSDMETILEQTFPSKFGGSLLDYQLVEEEDEQGFTKLMLYVAPHIPIDDEQQLIDTLLNAMKHSAPSVQLAQPEYQQAQTIGVRRQQPMLTPRGKYFSIYTLAMSRQARSQNK